MPYASCALGEPSAGGYLPPCALEYPKRNSQSDVSDWRKVKPVASCLFLTYWTPFPPPPEGSGSSGCSVMSASRWPKRTKARRRGESCASSFTPYLSLAFSSSWSAW